VRWSREPHELPDGTPVEGLAAAVARALDAASPLSGGTLTESASYTAFYPAEGVTVSGSKILMPLNATQTFIDGNMASGAYPMYATGTGETFTFHSPAGLMMLKFMGSGTIGSVELTDKNGANLAGNYEVDPANNTCTFCSMYKSKRYHVRPLEDVLEDIAWHSTPRPRR